MAEVIRGGLEPAGTAVGAGSPVVAALNLSPEPGNVEGNLLLAEKAIVEARDAYPGLAWVVLPELFTCGYTDLSSVHRYAEDVVEGPGARRLAELARELGVYIAYGFPERHPGTSGAAGVSDGANLVGPEGVLLTYRKRHLVRETGEDRVFVPGMELPTVEAGGLRVALAICWDLGFPEVVREAALGGAELVLAPAGWREPFGMQYELSCAARALDNGVYLASANQLGDYPESRFATPGGVYGPDGVGSRNEGFSAPVRWTPARPARGGAGTAARCTASPGRPALSKPVPEPRPGTTITELSAPAAREEAEHAIVYSPSRVAGPHIDRIYAPLYTCWGETGIGRSMRSS